MTTQENRYFIDGADLWIYYGLEKFLKFFKTKEAVYSFCVESIAEEKNLNETARLELNEVIKEELDRMFEKLDHRDAGDEILNKIL
ncbi:hypothetical protein QWZ08_20060 [Ferruginibacter paludis]|uniref:hypothetical protein n=1 Tax=Ferruginibacter paludis TaxID=1310417 RepID=UPI0025B417AB|nr:hypothetical protein [Ferruginibacter paludis]MDN3657959.1 hypothetical protein [Ferruginibacter paludis]